MAAEGEGAGPGNAGLAIGSIAPTGCTVCHPAGAGADCATEFPDQPPALDGSGMA